MTLLLLLRRVQASVQARFGTGYADGSVLGRLLRLLLGDLLLPFLALLALSFVLSLGIARDLDGVLAGPQPLGPNDVKGSVWFYWWLEQATTLGKPILDPDVVCAPSWQRLDGNFPNRVDAWAAWPFFHFFSFPRSYNLFVLTIPALGGLSAYAFLRTLTDRRIFAWIAGAFYGFNLTTLWELDNGRPVTALVACYPLFLAAYVSALGAKGWKRGLSWATLAALLGAVNVYAYLPGAFVLATLAVVVALGRLLFPADGVSRTRPAMVGAMCVLLGGAGSVPYLHEVLVLREHSTPIAAGYGQRQPGWPWEPRVWTELRDQLRSRPLPDAISRTLLMKELQERSMAVSELWWQISPAGGPAGAPWALSLSALLLAYWGRGRSLAWIAATLFLYSWALGPYLCDITPLVGRHLVLVAGKKVVLPGWWMVKHLPNLAGHFRPHRFFPLALLGTMAVWTIGVDALARRRGLPLALGVALLSAALAAAQLREKGGWKLPEAPLVVPPFINTLAAMPGDFSIAELPAGVGDATALYQVVHKKRRSEPVHDLTGALEDRFEAPRGCYELPFLYTLTTLGQAGSAPPTALSVAQAEASGFRFVILYPPLYRSTFGKSGPERAVRAQTQLSEAFGKPIYEDAQTVVYAFPTVGGKVSASASEASL